jgi:hypothetical protein
MKYSWTISCVKMELLSNVSETVSASILKGWCDMCCGHTSQPRAYSVGVNTMCKPSWRDGDGLHWIVTPSSHGELPEKISLHSHSESLKSYIYTSHLFTTNNEWYIFKMVPAWLWHSVKDDAVVLPCVRSAVCLGPSSFSRVHQSKCLMKSLFLVRTCGTSRVVRAGIHRGGAACHTAPRLKLADYPQRSETLWRWCSNMEQFQLRTPYYNRLELGLMSEQIEIMCQNGRTYIPDYILINTDWTHGLMTIHPTQYHR